MAGQLDQISRVIGSIEATVEELKRNRDEDRREANHRHADNLKRFDRIERKIDVNGGVPSLTGPQRAALASIAFALMAVIVWLLDRLLGSAFTWLISHIKFGG